jgi:hypothetical protein
MICLNNFNNQEFIKVLYVALAKFLIIQFLLYYNHKHSFHVAFFNTV